MYLHTMPKCFRCIVKMCIVLFVIYFYIVYDFTAQYLHPSKVHLYNCLLYTRVGKPEDLV